MNTTLAEIALERMAQDAKWGEQNHPNLPVDNYLGVVGADEARDHCEQASDEHRLTWAHILVEEVAEACEDTNTVQQIRAELIQVAAVAVAWVEAIDRAAV